MDEDRMLKISEMAVRLLAMIAVKDRPQLQQIAILSRTGFTPKEIAEILGTTPNTVRVTLVTIRRGEKHKKQSRLQNPEEKHE